MSKIKDNQFRESAEHRHPDFEPYLVYNDKIGSPTIFFKSYLNEDKLAQQLFSMRPDLYYYPENPEYKVIEIKQGGYARLPHSRFTVHTLDESPAVYSIRSIDRI